MGNRGKTIAVESEDNVKRAAHQTTSKDEVDPADDTEPSQIQRASAAAQKRHLEKLLDSLEVERNAIRKKKIMGLQNKEQLENDWFLCSKRLVEVELNG